MRAVRLCVCLTLLSVSASAQNAGWIFLFNGKNLEGWQANREPGSYVVENGILTTHSTDARSHLFYTGDDEVPDTFKNFELVVVARGEANSNSGIFFHTDHALRDSIGHLGTGYEVQLHTSPTEKHPTGSLYDIVDLEAPIVDATKWIEVRIRVEGKRIRVWVDGIQTVDYTEPENPERKPSRVGRLLKPEGGAIALQAHDPDSIFHFREVRLLPLPE